MCHATLLLTLSFIQLLSCCWQGIRLSFPSLQLGNDTVLQPDVRMHRKRCTQESLYLSPFSYVSHIQGCTFTYPFVSKRRITLWLVFVSFFLVLCFLSADFGLALIFSSCRMSSRELLHAVQEMSQLGLFPFEIFVLFLQLLMTFR